MSSTILAIGLVACALLALLLLLTPDTLEVEYGVRKAEQRRDPDAPLAERETFSLAVLDSITVHNPNGRPVINLERTTSGLRVTITTDEYYETPV